MTPVERLGPGDRRLVAVCLAVIVAGTAIGARYVSRAFPEASIDFRLTREEARRVAERELAARGFDVEGRRALGVFDHDDLAKVFLERELGLEKAAPLFGREAPVWRWSFRFVRPLEKGELRAFVAPSGELLAFRRILPEEAAASDPGAGRARAMAEETLRAHRGFDPGTLRLVEESEEKRPARVDRPAPNRAQPANPAPGSDRDADRPAPSFPMPQSAPSAGRGRRPDRHSWRR